MLCHKISVVVWQGEFRSWAETFPRTAAIAGGSTTGLWKQVGRWAANAQLILFSTRVFLEVGSHRFTHRTLGTLSDISKGLCYSIQGDGQQCHWFQILLRVLKFHKTNRNNNMKLQLYACDSILDKELFNCSENSNFHSRKLKPFTTYLIPILFWMSLFLFIWLATFYVKIGLPLMIVSLLMQKHVESFQSTIIICFYVCDGLLFLITLC